MDIKLAINILVALLFLAVGFGIGQIVAEIQVRKTLEDVFGDMFEETEDDDEQNEKM